ncbi:dockerin type I domain-containing protein [Pseudobacteroides cellulosolvens]|uniref:Dockerin domain-containing protein n=1 Tax=Pseudobacteroides cellulosolvens ATCC 35603 = DSM 2933 TaxID=398512 RepID=A0A0L6JHJ2_9FIRM|nr:dockerin type I domain-containing protein [Pseudobacteroides cellulosolvens]KNY25180.1 hypothetical protein Bccel_0437 [Pseudobacteroides cellulosolvens ATCC 35603 = DSM 2933]
MKRVFAYILFLVLVSTISSVCLTYAEEQTPVFETQKVSGYLKADGSLSNAGGNSGFKVYILGCTIEAISDDNGYFEVVGQFGSSDDLVVSIKKDNYLTRYVNINPINKYVLLGSAETPIEMWAGDINQDNSVNMSDIVAIAACFSTSKGESKYKGSIDINGDGAVNMSDVVIIARNFNRTSNDYIKPQINIDGSQPIMTPTPTAPIIQYNSLMIPYADYNITPGRNIVFCSTFQIAWDQLKKEVGEDVILTGKPLTADFLNKGFDWSNSISKNSYLAAGGKGNIVDGINSNLKAMFGEDAPIVEKVDPGKYIFYAFLLKEMKFATAFVDTDPIYFKDSSGKTEQVKSFGIRKDGYTKYKDLVKQVQLFDYKNNDDYIVKLLPEDTNEEIILAKVKPDDTLNNTYKAVMDRINNSTPSNLGLTDTIRIPEVDLYMEKDYEELKSTITNGTLKYCRIEKAYQNVKFNLDKEGAKLASEAIIVVATPGMGPHVDTSKHLVFDKQYMICLKQKDAQNPYLLIWVDNPDILVNPNVSSK